MIALTTPTKKALAELKLVEGRTATQSITKESSSVMFAHTTVTRPKHLRARVATWWLIAVIAALVVVLSANQLVTDVTLWAGFAVATRLAVVERRRVRRAAHRAAEWHRLADLEAVQVGGAHLVTSVSAA